MSSQRPPLPRVIRAAAGLAVLIAQGALAADDLPLPRDPMATSGVAGPALSGPLVSQIAPVDDRIVAQAVELYGTGRVAEADALAHAMADQTTRTALEWLAIRCNPGTIRFARIRRFLDSHSDWPNIATLQRRAEEALSAERLSGPLVLDFFAERTPLTANGRIALAGALLSSGEPRKAADIVREVWRREPLSAATETRVLSQFGLMIGPDDHRVRARALLLREQAGPALRAAARVDPDFVRLAQAQLAAQRKSGTAQALLARLPRALHGDPAFVFTQAMLHRRADKAELAAAAVLSLPAEAAIGDGDGWWTERRLIARKLLDAGKADLAYRIVAGHNAEGGAAQVEAEFHAGWIALRFLSDPPRALPHFARLEEVATTPHSRARAHYWQGRAYVALNEGEAAARHFRLAARHGATFHGQLARAETGETGYAPAQAPSLPAIAPLPARAVLLLQAAGAGEMAFTLLQDMAAARLNPAHLAALAGRLPLTATQKLTLGKLAHARGAPLEETAFPIDGVPAVAANPEVETPILHAIARQESAFNPDAVSGAGARGLMQMMPATARETARRFALAYDARRLTGDPTYSATLGGAHLADLLRAWRGSYVLSFAAYNAGSGNVRDWIAAYGDPRDAHVDPIDWIERIPFSETRHYVQKIMENLQVYRARLSGVTQVRLAQDLRRVDQPLMTASGADMLPPHMP